MSSYPPLSTLRGQVCLNLVAIIMVITVAYGNTVESE